MANVRTLNKSKYNISIYRFRELYYFCLQYEEWKEKIKEIRNPLKGMQYSGMPSSGIPSNPTESIAIECAEFSSKCTLIEKAAKEADPELYEYILFAVTHENITFKYLKAKMNIPCERDRYYDSRRKFYFVLDRNIRKREKENERILQ